MAALAAGTEEAAVEVFRRFVRRLLSLADSLLFQRLRQKLDAEDLVQSLFRSFFRRCRDGRIRATDWDQLWALLVVMTVRKCRNQVQHYQAACRDVRREISPPAEGETFAEWWHPLDRHPTPAEAAALAETLEQLRNSFDPQDQIIVLLYLQGCSVTDIRHQTRRAERTVRRVCQRVRKRLERLLFPPLPQPAANGR
jgi:RNA polymerase sigma-70 factor (ECF subfamily)